MSKSLRIPSDRPRDRKRTHRAKSETLARKQQRRAKYATNGRVR
jgi:hypothetical protein